MDSQVSAPGLVPVVKSEKPKHRTWSSDLAQEVGEYFSYEPRVPSMNAEGGARSDPFGRVHQYSGGAGHFFMTDPVDDTSYGGIAGPKVQRFLADVV